MKNRQVKINWPGGWQTGPHDVTFTDEWDHEVWVDGKACIIPIQWCEPAEPEIEEGRLVRAQSENATVYGKYIDSHRVLIGGRILNNCTNIKPLHRRWDELTNEEQGRLKWAVGMNPTIKSIFSVAYKLITGEEHP